MADPILGSNVVLQIDKAGQYRTYLCAIDCSIDFKTDLQSVKTIGDGYWQRYRAQSLGYVIKLNGLVKMNNINEPTAFDMIDYIFNMAEFNFVLTFEDETGAIKAYYGVGTIESGSLSGGTSDFAKGDFTIYGNGPLTTSNSNVVCDLSVNGISQFYNSTSLVSVNVSYTGSGTLDHFEYTTTTGGNRTSVGSTSFTVPNPASGISYPLTVYPVCVGNIDGGSYTVTIIHHYYGEPV